MSENFSKDSLGAVINNDLSEYERFKLKRLQAVRENSLQEKVKLLEKEILDLKNRLTNIESGLN
jgi:predicted nuclease with TOPRIM domain